MRYPHFATYRAIIVRYPTKTSTKYICDTIAASVARYEKYRCWASKAGRQFLLGGHLLALYQKVREGRSGLWPPAQQSGTVLVGFHRRQC